MVEEDDAWLAPLPRIAALAVSCAELVAAEPPMKAPAVR
jgi:hypothetical protein